ncbi:unnamed protein product [Lathyrus sativus]|nr:unnamed protein product [Lathyrus sativus]
MSEASDSVFVAARSKLIVTMLEEIRVYITQRWESNRKKITKYDDIILPNIKKRMERESQKTNHWIVRSAGEYEYEVRHTSLNGEKYAVNLNKKECPCRLWMLIGLPCYHAMSCMKYQHLEIDDFVPDCYKKEKYAAYYKHVIYSLNGEALWSKTSLVDLQPPPIKRQPVRPKKKRNRKDGEMVRDETHMKRERHGIKFSRCHKDGHNKATCKLPQPQASSSQVQDPTSQQPSEANTSQSPPVATSQPSSQSITSQPLPPVATS